MEFAMTNNVCFHELNESEISTVGGGFNLNLCVSGAGCIAAGYLIGGAGVATSITKKDPSRWISSGAVAENMINKGKAMIAVGLQP